jgi:hypothetical protein
VVVARALAPKKDWAPPVLDVVQPVDKKATSRVAVPPVRLERGALLLLLEPRRTPVKSPLPWKRIPTRVPRAASNLLISKLRNADDVRGLEVEKFRLANGLVTPETVWEIVLIASALPALRRLRGRIAVSAMLRALRGPSFRSFLAEGNEAGGIDKRSGM